jgi:hypothetical protein
MVCQRPRNFNWSNGQIRLVSSPAHVSPALEYQSLFGLPLAEVLAAGMPSKFFRTVPSTSRPALDAGVN